MDMQNIQSKDYLLAPLPALGVGGRYVRKVRFDVLNRLCVCDCVIERESEKERERELINFSKERERERERQRELINFSKEKES